MEINESIAGGRKKNNRIFMHRNEKKNKQLRKKNKRCDMDRNQMKEFQEVESKMRELSCT